MKKQQEQQKKEQEKLKLIKEQEREQEKEKEQEEEEEKKEEKKEEEEKRKRNFLTYEERKEQREKDQELRKSIFHKFSSLFSSIQEEEEIKDLNIETKQVECTNYHEHNHDICKELYVSFCISIKVTVTIKNEILDLKMEDSCNKKFLPRGIYENKDSMFIKIALNETIEILKTKIYQELINSIDTE